MTTPWSDTPPSEFTRRLWIKSRDSGAEFVCASDVDPEHYQFGPRVLSAEETVALAAEVERLRAEVATLRELRVFDWRSKERLEKRLSKYEDVRYVTAQGQGEEVSVPAEELDQLRAAAAELAEIHKVWGIGGRSS